MESIEKMNRIRLKAALLSLLFAVLILVIKFAAYFRTHSTAVLSDAVESIVNVLAASLALIMMRKAAEPADKEHPYGHGKLEYFSAAFEGSLIFFAALVIFAESLKVLIHGSSVRDLDLGMIMMVVAGVLNLGIGLYVLRVGQRYHSDALKASGKHILSDVVTTVGALIGLLLVRLTDLIWIDPAVAILVAVQLGYSGFKVMRENFAALMDAQEPRALELLADAILRTRRPWVIDIHHLRIMRNGRFHHVDAHLVLPEFWDVKQAHEKARQFEHAIVESYPFDGEISFHLDPCERKFCSVCDCENCPIRREPFTQVKELTVDEIIRENPRK